jgi:predicted MarR family transcription regulator
MTNSDSPKSLIAASSHLVSGRAPDLSAVEFGLMIAGHAFNRWIVRCMAAAGLPDLTSIDVIVFHHVFHRQRGKKLADICFTLNIEDTHIVSYSLKKLERLGVVHGERSGKEVLYSVTPAGSEVIARYVQVREQCLIDGLPAASNGLEFSQDLANLLRGLSGVYDQAARAATSL